MSRETKIKDTKQVLSGNNYDFESQVLKHSANEGCIPFNRDGIKYYADEGCLAACQLLYDLNIQTHNSGANVVGMENNESTAFIGISYDSLSEENKKIANTLAEEGLVEISHSGGCGPDLVVTISFPINGDDLVGTVSDKFMLIASQFTQQDVLYGIKTEEEIRKKFPPKGNGLYHDPYTLGETTKEQVDKSVALEISEYFPDGEGKLFITEDLLRKHLEYIQSKKEEQGTPQR